MAILSATGSRRNVPSGSLKAQSDAYILPDHAREVSFAFEMLKLAAEVCIGSEGQLASDDEPGDQIGINA
jgi:hypothetical protein